MRATGFITFMDRALEEAAEAAARGEAPIGAVVTRRGPRGGDVVATAGNETRARNDVTAHAEILALRRAGRRLGAERLIDCDLWVTLEPCAMCAGAIAHARIARLYIGAMDPKSGGALNGAGVLRTTGVHHTPEIVFGLRETDSAALLRDFFAERRTP